MRRLITMVCMAVAIGTNSNIFAQDAVLVAKNTEKSCDTCKPLPIKSCKPTKAKALPCPCDCEPEPEPCCFFEQGLALEDNFTPPCDVNYYPGYNAAAEINVAGCWDLNVDASFIYWDYYQDGMDVAYIDSFRILAQEEIVVQGGILYQNTGYKPGFKVGVGWDTHFDNWTWNAEYTWFHHAQSTHTIPSDTVGFTSNQVAHINKMSKASAPLPGAAQKSTVAGYSPNTWLISQNALDSIKNQDLTDVSSTWSMHMDILDVVLGRPYYQGTHLTVSPTAGLRGLWIRQRMNVSMSDDQVVVESSVFSAKNSSHSWAVGPKAGINTHWILSDGIRFDGVIGASILYTRYTGIERITTIIVPGNDVFSVTSKSQEFNAVRPTLDMGLGLGYGAYAFRNRFFFDLAVRYDFSQFWSQNVMRNFVAGLNATDGAVGDLVLHGLTITLRCDF